STVHLEPEQQREGREEWGLVRALTPISVTSDHIARLTTDSTRYIVPQMSSIHFPDQAPLCPVQTKTYLMCQPVPPASIRSVLPIVRPPGQPRCSTISTPRRNTSKSTS